MFSGVLTTTDTVSLTGPLDSAVLRRAAAPLTVTVDDEARARIDRGRSLFHGLRHGDGGEERKIYGATTGFGALVGYAGRADEADQCDNTLAHLGAGQGPDLPHGIARAALLLRARSLAQGYSGVSAEVVERLTAMFATTFVPAVPRYGSVGASGDLIPLAYATQALRGRGHAYLDGRRIPAADALEAAGLRPLALDGRDALALVNGTSVTTAATALALDAVRGAHRALTVLTCLLADLLGCDPGFLDEDLLRAYGHPGAVVVGARMRRTLTGVAPSGTRPLQEPYSIRCAPQLLGAAEDALRYVDGVVAADLGGVSDNPLFFEDGTRENGTGTGKVVHGGNFFGQPAAFAADLLASVTAGPPRRCWPSSRAPSTGCRACSWPPPRSSPRSAAPRSRPGCRACRRTCTTRTSSRSAPRRPCAPTTWPNCSACSAGRSRSVCARPRTSAPGARRLPDAANCSTPWSS